MSFRDIRVPPDIIEAARKVEQYMREHEIAALMGLAKRELAQPVLDRLAAVPPFKWD